MNRKRLRDKQDLGRAKNVRRERSRVLIVTEGTETEVQYFKGLCRYLRATGVDVHGADIKGAGRDPMNVVSKARNEFRSSGSKRAKTDYDAVWCVLDVDEHSTLEPAIELARKYGFEFAVSNPCFEIWLLWHYEDCERQVTASELSQRLKKHGITGKAIPVDFDYRGAVQASKRVFNRNGDVPKNPGSGVWHLSDFLHEGQAGKTS